MASLVDVLEILLVSKGKFALLSHETGWYGRMASHSTNICISWCENNKSGSISVLPSPSLPQPTISSVVASLVVEFKILLAIEDDFGEAVKRNEIYWFTRRNDILTINSTLLSSLLLCILPSPACLKCHHYIQRTFKFHKSGHHQQYGPRYA